jgi:ribosomal protein L13
MNVSSHEGVALALKPSCKIHFAKRITAMRMMTVAARKSFRPLMKSLRVYRNCNSPHAAEVLFFLS